MLRVFTLISVAVILLSACAAADANKIPITVFRSPT